MSNRVATRRLAVAIVEARCLTAAVVRDASHVASDAAAVVGSAQTRPGFVQADGRDTSAVVRVASDDGKHAAAIVFVTRFVVEGAESVVARGNASPSPRKTSARSGEHVVNRVLAVVGRARPVVERWAAVVKRAAAVVGRKGAVRGRASHDVSRVPAVVGGVVSLVFDSSDVAGRSGTASRVSFPPMVPRSGAALCSAGSLGSVPPTRA